MPSPQRTAALAALLLAALATGCANTRRQAFLEQKASRHVYDKPLSVVWPQAQALLREKGFGLRASGTEAELLTEWLQMTPISSLGTVFSRYLVRGYAQPGNRCTVEFLRQDRTESGRAEFGPSQAPNTGGIFNTANTGTRDLAIEWELLLRVEPELGKSLQAEAEKL